MDDRGCGRVADSENWASGCHEEATLMYPAEFVESKIKSGQIAELVDLIDEYAASVRRRRTENNADVTFFARAFLISVITGVLQSRRRRR
jgi:hypothetical protein